MLARVRLGVAELAVKLVPFLLCVICQAGRQAGVSLSVHCMDQETGFLP